MPSGKLGYGTTSEAIAHNKPFIFIRRNFFNEEPFLRKELEKHTAAVEMGRQEFFSGRWRRCIEEATSVSISPEVPSVKGGEHVALTLMEVSRGERELHKGPPNPNPNPNPNPSSIQVLLQGSFGTLFFSAIS